jgi:light-regulated signal transduction histidine kinase (bacteriophytochrome)
MPAPSTKITSMQPRIRRPAPSSSRREEDGVCLTSDSLHDLASPINQVCSLSDLIFKKYEGRFEEETRVLFGLLRSSADRLKNLMGGLRTYMQVAAEPPCGRFSNGNALLAGALAMLQHTIARSEALVTSDSLPKLWCDPSQMTYALASLIENAIKFRGPQRPEIHIGAFSDKKTWVLSIRDNGMGIDARYLDRIFGAFKRIHNDAYAGSGVGLAITRRLIERHGGQIWVESELGHGSTFFVELPKVAERRTKPSAEKRANKVA